MARKKSEFTSRNEVTIRGNVTRVYATSKVAVITVATANPTTHKTDFPQILFFDKDMIEKVPQELKLGDRVTMRCVVQTSFKRRDVSLLCLSYTKEMNRLDAELEGAEYVGDVNKFLIEAKVRNIYKVNDKCALMSVIVHHEGYTYYPSVVCFGNNASRANASKPGDVVQVLGYIQTKLGKKDGKNTIFQSVVAQNMRTITAT